MELVKPFHQPNADSKVIAKNGCELIKCIYKCKNEMLSLNDLRFQQHKVLTAKSSFKLEKLPPTVEAACVIRKHTFNSKLGLATNFLLLIGAGMKRLPTIPKYSCRTLQTPQ